jgi:putative peptidoglycan lipid II flippase
MGFRGLALGTSVSMIANGGVLLVLLRRHLEGLDGRRLLATLAKTLAASCLMAAAAYGVEHLLRSLVPGTRVLPQAVRLFSAIGAGLAVLGISAKLLRIREFDDALAGVTARLIQM